MNTLMADESHHAVAEVGGAVVSDLSGSSDGFKPSPKLRARVEKLAKWRIDPACISLETRSESHGGHATVSRGGLNSGKRGEWRGWEFRQQNVAVKKMRLADDTDFERVLGLTIREAEFLAKLDHKNIVKLEGLVEALSKGIIWLVFPWAEYGNLKEFIARESWDIPERISLISDVAKGLEYLHTRNPPICHGDLKSLNVLIYGDRDGKVRRDKMSARITDFGSARRLPPRDPNTQIEEMVTQLPSAQPPSAAFCATTKTITLTGNKYTLRWAAPELLLQDQLSVWSDIWALGWIVYEVMTGSVPFEDAASEMAVVERVIQGKLPSLTDNVHLLLVHELCSLMNMCWEAQPIQRPTADSCRRSIEKMPMFAPEMEDDERILDYGHLRHLAQMYQSRGEYARAFTFFVEALDDEMNVGFNEQIQVLRDLAQLARLSEEYSETIAVYDVIWEIYRKSHGKDMCDLGDAFCDLAELHRLRNENRNTRKPHYEGQDIQGEHRVGQALRDMGGKRRIPTRLWNTNATANLDDRTSRANALWGAADVFRRRGEYEKAITFYSEVLEIYSDLGNEAGRADAVWGLADVHRRRREYELAIPFYLNFLEFYSNFGLSTKRADALWGLADVHRCRGEYEEAIQLYSEVLKIRTGYGDSKSRASALWGLAYVHRRRSEYEKAFPLYSELLKICTGLRDRTGRASALWGLADMHRRQSECKKAIPLYSEVLKICTDLDDRTGRAGALWGLADTHRGRGEYKKAIPLYSEVLKIRTDLGDKEGRASALWGLADVHRRRREYEMAITFYLDVLEIRTDLGDSKGRADVLWGLADVYRCRGEYEQAVPLYSEVSQIRIGLGDRRGRADAMWGLAEVHRLRSEYERAIPFYSDVSQIRADLGDKKGRADALWGLAEVHRCRGKYDEAIPLYFEVLEIRTDLDDRTGRASALWGLADVHRRRSEYEKAVSLYSEASQIHTGLGNWTGRADALWGLAEVHRLGSEYEKAIPLYSEVLQVRTDMGDKKGRASAMWGLAEVHRCRGKYEEAIPLYSDVLEICTYLGDKEGRASALWGLAEVQRCVGRMS